MSSSSLRPGEFVIHDSTPEVHYFHPGFGRGLDLSLRGAEGYGESADDFPQELLIPESEWQARIQEMEQTKSRVSDLIVQAGLPCKNQQQTNYCVTEDTEVLTDRGWVGWPSYNGTDLLGTMNTGTGLLEFQAPLALHTYEHNGPMVYSTNRSVDFGVTPDHRMLVRKWDQGRRSLSPEFTFQKARDLGWYFGLPHAPSGFVGTRLERVSVEGDRGYGGDDFLALVALVVSDGYAGGTENTKNWVSFACFVDARLPRVRALAARIGFREKESTPGVFVRYDAGALARWFRANAYTSPELGSHNKRVPDLVKQVSGGQILHFLTCYGDQSHDRGNQFFSTSRRVVDDLQELLLRVGKRGSIWSEERAGKIGVLESGKRVMSRRTMHHLHVRSDETLSINRKKHLEVETYKGPVYCATVPNSTLITRRNGSVLVSGNCWANAGTHCLEVIRAVANEPQVILSAASVAAPIKHFMNVGGWGKEALDYIGENGIVPESLWPANAISRQYYTDANKAAGLKYRHTEWWALDPSNMQQVVSCLLRRIPISVGYTWWGHQVTLCDPVWLDGAIAGRIRNSWGMDWPTAGAGGFSILQGRKLIPDDACAPRVATAA